MKIRLPLALLVGVLLHTPAWAQSVLQAGPAIGGHVPMYQLGPGQGFAAVVDSGFASGLSASGTQTGAGLSELLQVNHDPGSGPFGTHVSLLDAPINSTNGYHALSFDANALGGGLLSYNAFGGAAPLPLQCDINGIVSQCVGATVTGLPAVPNNAALLLESTAGASVVYREGFTIPGDSGAAIYNYSSGTCSLNGGNGDNGSQVKASGGGCWLLHIPPEGVFPGVWGAVGDGVTNDNAAFTAMLNSNPGKVILGSHEYCITALTFNFPITVQGSASGSDNGPADGGFVACSANPTMLTINTGANGSKFDNFSVSPGTSGSNATSGTAIVDNAEQTVLTRLVILNACHALDENGNTNTYRDWRITNPALQPNCRLVRIGPGAVSIDAMLSNIAIGAQAAAGPSSNGTVNIGTAGFELLNEGGAYIGDNVEALYMDVGFMVDPGAGQVVDGGWITHAAFDTVNFYGIYINPTSSSAQIGQLVFDHTWTGSIGQIGGRYGRTPGVSVFNPAVGVELLNTAGSGNVGHIAFDGHRMELSGAIGVDVGANVVDVRYINGFDCGASFESPGVYAAYEIESGGMGRHDILNNTIGGTCDTAVSTVLTDFVNNSKDVELNVQGNHFVDYPNTTIQGASPAAIAIFVNNFNIDTRSLPLTAAASIDPGFSPLVTLSGATPVSTIGSIWPGRVLRFVNGGGAAFVTGGNIAAVPTSFGLSQFIECQGLSTLWSCR